jgi:hypothetical protein
MRYVKHIKYQKLDFYENKSFFVVTSKTFSRQKCGKVEKLAINFIIASVILS